MSTLHIQLLGDFRLLDGDEPVTTIHQARLQVLLAYLLLHRDSPQARQQMAFLFWPDTSERQARTNLRRELHHLRQGLPNAEQYLYSDNRFVQWRTEASFTLDVADFEQLFERASQAAAAGRWVKAQAAWEGAVDQYRGRLLPTCYDEWILPLREQLEQRFIRALEQLMLLLEERRDYSAAIHHAQRLLRHDPLHETTYRRLMRLHALHGDRVSALRIYHTCTNILRRELGVEPNQETQAVYARLVNMTAPPTSRTPSATQLRSEDQLVGRQAEWQQLRTAWRRAMQGRAHFVLVAGEAGIGKTRLAEELFESTSQQGIMAARTRSYAAEGALAYAPVIEWLRAESLRATLNQLDDVWLTEVARLLPELLVEQPDLPRPEPLSERWQRQRLFEALARAVTSDNQPRLFLIDDLQWCDLETLEWLRYLLHFAARARLLVIGTVRVEEIDSQHPLRALVMELRNSNQLTEIELGPLSADETTTLAVQVAAQELDSALTAQLYQETEGNPLFAVEMVRVRASEGGTGVRDRVFLHHQYGSTEPQLLPPKVQATIQARLAQLSPPALELASLAATIGRSFTFDVLVHASDSDEETLVRGLDELWQRRIVREQGANAYDFSHDLIREVAHAQSRPARRRLLHRRVAEALETVYAAALDGVSGQIAAHFERAGLGESALAYYQRAASAASHLFADREAADYLQKGLDIIRTAPWKAEHVELEITLLVALGDALAAIGGFGASGAGEAYSRAWELCLTANQPTQKLLALRGLRRFYGTRSEWRKARELSEQLLYLVREHDDASLNRIAHHLMGAALLNLGELVPARNHSEQSIAVRELKGNRHDVLQELDQPSDLAQDLNLYTLPRLAQTLWLLGFPDQARQRSIEADRLATLLFNPMSHAFVHQHAAMLNQWLGNVEQVQIRSKEIVALTTQYELSFFHTLGILFGGWVLVAHEQISEGTAQIRQALALLQEQNNTVLLPYHLSLLADSYGRAGRFNRALTILDDALKASAGTDDHVWDAELHRQKGELLLRRNANLGEIETCFLTAIEIAQTQHAKSLELRAVTSLSRLWQSRGKQTEAHQILAAIYDWFSEGFDTPDLQAAQALLDELA